MTQKISHNVFPDVCGFICGLSVINCYLCRCYFWLPLHLWFSTIKWFVVMLSTWSRWEQMNIRGCVSWSFLCAQKRFQILLFTYQSMFHSIRYTIRIFLYVNMCWNQLIWLPCTNLSASDMNNVKSQNMQKAKLMTSMKDFLRFDFLTLELSLLLFVILPPIPFLLLQFIHSSVYLSVNLPHCLSCLLVSHGPTDRQTRTGFHVLISDRQTIDIKRAKRRTKNALREKL